MQEVITYIEKHGQKNTLPKGCSIFQMAENTTHIYYLKAGWIKIGQETEDGQDITLSIRKAGDLYGLAEVLTHTAIRLRYAVSLTEVDYYTLSKEQLEALLKQRPILWKPLSEMMAMRLIETQNFMRAITNLQVPERLAWFLKQFITYKNGRPFVELPMTHEELSNLIGCSRQKVTANLSAWRKAQYITYERGKIELLNEQLFT